MVKKGHWGHKNCCSTCLLVRELSRLSHILSIPYNDCTVTYTRYRVTKIKKINSHAARDSCVFAHQNAPGRVHRDKEGRGHVSIISLLQCVVNLGGSVCMHLPLDLSWNGAPKTIYLAFVHAYTSLLKEKQSIVERGHLHPQFVVCVDRIIAVSEAKEVLCRESVG
jgi:hypothetical protein